MPEEREALYQVIDMSDAFGKAAQTIFAKIRIAEMLAQVLEHERECGGGVSKIVDKESGHGLESLHLLVLDESAGHFQVAEGTGDLVGNAGEEIEILSG